VELQLAALMRHFAIVAAVLLVWLAAATGAAAGTPVPARPGPTARAAPARFDVVDLGYFMARQIDERPGLNQYAHAASWQVVGETTVDAAAVTTEGAMLIPGTPESSNSFAFGINDSDELTGIIESRSDIRDTQAFLYRSGSLQILPSLGGRSAVAKSINKDGIVVGNALTDARQMHAVEWRDGHAHDLGALPGGDFSRAFEVNAHGDVAGEANATSKGRVHAVLWTHERINDLGLLRGGTLSSAQAVNEKHQAVGYADDGDGGSRAVLFSDGHVRDLGSLGDEPGNALSINDAGQIVGSSAVAEGKLRAFLWEKGHLYNLNQLIAQESGWLLLTAYRVNAKGQILAYGFYQGHTHACLLMPNPVRTPPT
jgi:probable HAF family extracellular repeat protein